MDPLTRGSLFHEVQYVLLSRLREPGTLPVTAENRIAVVEMAGDVLDEVAGRYAERLAPAIPRVWRDEVEGIRTDLRGWIRGVAEEQGAWVPTYFEMSFGLGDATGRDAQSRHPEAVVLDGFRLRGAIDMVERDAERDVWRVTDHKTGRALKERFVVLGHGEVLQPLLYALAAEHHLDAGGQLLAPGFIDAHTHDDRLVLSDPDMLPKISQGVTTVVGGNCGLSLAPLAGVEPVAPLNLLGGQDWYRFTTDFYRG